MIGLVNGFYGHVRRNDMRSVAMFAGFLLAFQLMAAVTLLVPLCIFDVGHAPLLSWNGYAMRYAPLVLVGSVALFAVWFGRHVSSVRATVAFREVGQQVEPRLFGIVAVQAIAAGVPVPRVGIIETSARNAFACGLSRQSAVVVVTRGLLQALDDDELAAVVAHEITHIRNNDIRLMAAANAMMGTLLLLRSRPRRGVSYGKVLLGVVVPPLGLLFLLGWVAHGVAFTLARVSRLLVSSSREYVADAEAVRLTHNPAALVSALRKVAGRSAVPGVDARMDAMMIDGAVDGPLASHPTIGERIAVLTRLAGPMMADGWHRGARPAPVDAAPDRWRQPQPASEPARSLLGRVNAGAGRRVLGQVARHGAVYVLGSLALAALWTHVLSDQLTRMDQVRSTFGPDTEAHDAFGRPSEDPATPGGRAMVQRRVAEVAMLDDKAATDALGAGCFATGLYGKNGRLGIPTGVVSLEHYLGQRARSVAAVGEAAGPKRDQALLAYVETRKAVLGASQIFLGGPGLSIVQAAYGSAEDAVILDMLRSRINERMPAFGANRQVASELALLVSAPGRFLPCVARGT